MFKYVTGQKGKPSGVYTSPLSAPKHCSGGFIVNSLPLERQTVKCQGVSAGKTLNGRTCWSIGSMTSLAMPVQMEYWCLSQGRIILQKVWISGILFSLLTLDSHQ